MAKITKRGATLASALGVFGAALAVVLGLLFLNEHQLSQVLHAMGGSVMIACAIGSLFGVLQIHIWRRTRTDNTQESFSDETVTDRWVNVPVLGKTVGVVSLLSLGVLLYYYISTGSTQRAVIETMSLLLPASALITCFFGSLAVWSHFAKNP